MTNRFYISKIRIEGENKKTVNIELSLGLNLIIGSSDCGKSHLYKIIYFVLGGSKAPDEKQNVPESKGYDTYYVEITGKNKTFTLKRNRNSESSLYIYESALDDINESTKVDTKKKTNISSELLKRLGISGRKILHRLNKTGNLSISDLKRLFFVIEDDISMETKSPILSSQYTEAARGRSIFKCFLDDSNYSSFSTTISQEAINAGETYTKEYIKTLIKNTEDELKKYEIEYAKIDDKFFNITTEYKRKEDIQKVIFDFEEQINSLRQRKKELNDVLQQNQILYNRFELLKEYYNNDLKRIDFIKEGNENLENIKNLNCPLCGSLSQEENISNIDIVEESINYEKNKILTNISELDNSILDVLKDVETTKNELRGVEEKILHKLSEYRLNIEPELFANEKNISEYVKAQITIKNKERNEQLLEKLKSDLSKVKEIVSPLDDASDSLKLNEILVATDIIKRITNLEQEIQCLVNDWGIDFYKSQEKPKEVIVKFDTENCDINIDNRPRSSFGQGIRAILYTAFLIGFLNYCIKNNLPHPGFVVIDSPLTTYKKHKLKSNVNNEDLEAETHQLFYQSLSKLTNEQIIVIENSDKYPEKIDNINIVDLENGLFPEN